MSSTELTYRSIRKQFVTAFPELRAAYERLASDAVFGGDGQPSPYVLIEQLFADYIEVLLAMLASPLRDRALLKSFGFVERMLASVDQDLVGLAQIGLMEGREQWWFHRALPYVGPLWRDHAIRMGESGWDAAVAASGPSMPMPDREINDLFGVREAIAQQLQPEGVALEDVPGATYWD